MTKTRQAPKNPLISPRFSGISTFGRLPYLEDPKKGEANVAILGIPWDGGTTFRPGARFAPRAMRDASVLNRNYHPVLGVNIYEKLQVVDAGDVLVNPLNLMETFGNIEKKIATLRSRGMRVVSLGGDHSLLLPVLRGMKRTLDGPLTLVHFDAHTDSADQAWGERYHHGTPIRRAIEEKLLESGRIFQIGIRGPLTAASQESEALELGLQCLTVEGFHEAKTREAFFSKLKKVAGKGPVYITFDVDGVDPAFAPGTGTPVVGGLTSFEALSCLRRLDGLRIVGGDIVEVCPAYDHADITSLLGCAVAFEQLALMSRT